MNAEIVIAVCAIIVSIVATSFSIWIAFIHRRHMQLSVRPIASFPLADYEEHIGVYLANKGLGPMRIISFKVEGDGGKVTDDLISIMPPNIQWTNFHESVDDATVENGTKLDLLELKDRPSITDYATKRDRVRKILSTLTIRVQYEDLYGKLMKEHVKKLTFFGRHFK